MDFPAAGGAGKSLAGIVARLALPFPATCSFVFSSTFSSINSEPALMRPDRDEARTQMGFRSSPSHAQEDLAKEFKSVAHITQRPLMASSLMQLNIGSVVLPAASEATF